MTDEAWERHKLRVAQGMRESGCSSDAISQKLDAMDLEREEEKLDQGAMQVLEQSVQSGLQLLGPDGKPARS